MPKDTFFNLPDDKRQLIESKAITEFAAHGFDKASINRIVKKSGIAKGSFYQYFTDKKDLFIYLLVTVAAGRKIKYMSPVLMNPEGYDIFTLIRELFLSGLNFARANPELERLGMWMLNNTSHPIYEELYGAAENSSANILTDMMRTAQDRGEVRKGIDLEYINHVFLSLMPRTMDFCLKRAGRAKDSMVTEVSDDLMETVDLMIDFMKNGIGVA